MKNASTRRSLYFGFAMVIGLINHVSASSETLQLSCEGVLRESDSHSSTIERKLLSKSYVIANRAIGLMQCSTWNERTIHCSGSNQFIRQRDDGKGSYAQRVDVSVEFDRISGAVTDTTRGSSLIKVRKANPYLRANPYGPLMIDTYEPFTWLEVFEGKCVKAAKRF